MSTSDIRHRYSEYTVLPKDTFKFVNCFISEKSDTSEFFSKLSAEEIPNQTNVLAERYSKALLQLFDEAIDTLCDETKISKRFDHRKGDKGKHLVPYEVIILNAKALVKDTQKQQRQEGNPQTKKIAKRLLKLASTK